jgi:EAL domain-containing protein (putative c-di-GMP-specific phosphodiesterase class I)
MRKESGRQLMDALVTFLSRNHHNVIIEGVESEAHKNGCREWSGLLFRDITGRKSVLNNWSLMILP